ncbi:hypothetical protein V2O64_10670 [Verrucomicrobiaceae bacterium 227]
MKEMWRLLVLCILLPSCTSRMGYRQSPGKAIESHGERVSLAHVEIDDQGELTSREQLKRVTDHIRAESDEPLLLVVYIHGWNRNSSSSRIEGGGDLINFRKWLKEVNEADPGQKTMGVFVSWRGRSLSTFPVGVDYFHRHAAARRMGGVAGTEVLHEIGATARAANAKSRIVMMGHSMGGAILESSFSESIASRVAMKHAEGKRVKRRDFPADLIVTINSAESAIHARQLISTFKSRKIRDIEGGPLIVSITSQDDIVTRLAFPLGNFLGRWVLPFNVFNTGVSGMYRERQPADLLQGTQAAAHRTTVGHFQPLFSHQFRVGAARERSLKEVMSDNRSARRGSGFVVRGTRASFVFERPKKEYYNDTPYWIVPVPGAIMKNHEDIWNGSFVGMITALMSLTK